jgi:Lysyl oxidase
MHRTLSPVLAITFLVAGGLLETHPDARSPEILVSPAGAVTWQGSVTGGVNAGGPAECAPGCDRFDLRVALPRSVWDHRAGGLQVAIRWTSAAPGDNVRLYVYRGATLVAKSDGIIAIAQGVLIPSAANGTYRIYAAYDADSPSPSIRYQGLAEVEYDPRPFPARRLMPDLEARPQQNLGFDPGGIFFDEISTLYPSCYRSEVEEEGARLCLRFDQTFANVGEGSMELRFSVPTAAPEGNHDVFQRLYSSVGEPEDRLAGQVEFHPAHGHYHFTSFGLSRLWKVDARGKTVGRHPVREKRWNRRIETTLARAGRKVSFCLADTNIDFWGRKGDGPRQYIAPDCLFPFESDGVTDHFVQGITRGWADIYDWYLPDQYIDVSGVADGIYVLETVADPDDLLAEADESNNCETIVIRLAGASTGTPSATRVGPGPRCEALGR